MIKLGGRTGAGRGLIVLGIDDMNVNRLKQGHPIHVHADELGFAGEIIIHYGSTMAKLRAEFAELIGSETRVTDTSKGVKRN